MSEAKKIRAKRVKDLFVKRILRRGFKRKQRECLKQWFNEWAEANPEDLENFNESNYTKRLQEVSDKFFDWAEANKTLNPKIWGKLAKGGEKN